MFFSGMKLVFLNWKQAEGMSYTPIVKVFYMPFYPNDQPSRAVGGIFLCS